MSSPSLRRPLPTLPVERQHEIIPHSIEESSFTSQTARNRVLKTYSLVCKCVQDELFAGILVYEKLEHGDDPLRWFIWSHEDRKSVV